MIATDQEIKEICCLIADGRIIEAFELLSNREFTEDQEDFLYNDIGQMIEDEEGPLDFLCIFGKDNSGWYLVDSVGNSLV